MAVVATPSAQACPGETDVRRALSAQLGAGVGAGWRLSYEATPARENATAPRSPALRMTLADPARSVRMRRELEVADDDCRARADAIALIVHRYFAVLAPAAPSPAPLAPASAASAAAPVPAQRPARADPRETLSMTTVSPSSRSSPPPEVRASPQPPVPGPAPGPTRARPRLWLEVGAGLWTRRGAASGTLGLRLAWDRFEVALGVLAPRASTLVLEPAGGEVAATATGGILSAGVAWQRQDLRLAGGPLAIVCRESARTRGIRVAGENSGTTAALGIAAGASRRAFGRWVLGLDAGAARAAFGNRFVVAGWGPVAAPPAWQGVVVARLGYGFFP